MQRGMPYGGRGTASILGRSANVPTMTHTCALCSDAAERERIGVGFLREGLQHGDRCLCLVDQFEAARGLEPATRQLSAGDAWYDRGLDVHRAADVCLEAGRFSLDRMKSFLADSAAHADDAGYPALRVIVEMSWLQRQPRAVDDLLLYEAAFDHLAQQASAVVMCLYDLHRVGVDLLVEALRTHETVLLEDTVLVNPHYQVGAHHGAATETGESQTRPAGADGRWEQASARERWTDLTESELRIVAHVVDGLTNREIATLLVVSHHTVAAHLKHIYVKLGIHTRVELTVLALKLRVEG